MKNINFSKYFINQRNFEITKIKNVSLVFNDFSIILENQKNSTANRYF